MRGGVRISQLKPSNCFRRHEKNSFTFHFDTSLSSLMWNSQSYPTSFERKNVTFLGWRGCGRGQNTDKSYIFSAGQYPPTPRICAPLSAYSVIQASANRLKTQPRNGRTTMNIQKLIPPPRKLLSGGSASRGRPPASISSTDIDSAVGSSDATATGDLNAENPVNAWRPVA